MKDIHFDSRVAVITWAGHNLGRAYGAEFASRGAAAIRATKG